MPESPTPKSTAAVIEIVEKAKTTDDTLAGSVIIPNEVRINGIPLLVTEDGIQVHEMDFPPGDCAKVTLTLIARRVVIAAEGDL
jgi:hypothetical protein